MGSFLFPASSIYDEGPRRGGADVDAYHHRRHHGVPASPGRPVKDDK